jgi:tRNA(Ile)-lysidine synthase
MNRVGGTLRKVDAGHVEAVRRLAAAPRPQARIDLPNRVIARREYGQLVFEPSGRLICGDFAYAVEGPGSYDLEAVGRSVSLEFEANGSLPGNAGSPWTALLNGDLIRFPLTIRNFRPGDRFVPFGMKGRKKIKDFFIERKISDSERRNVPLLTQGSEILWVCGLRIDDRFKMTEGAGKGLRVTFFPGGRGSLSPEAAE